MSDLSELELRPAPRWRVLRCFILWTLCELGGWLRWQWGLAEKVAAGELEDQERGESE
jgi:hypothetical protein